MTYGDAQGDPTHDPKTVTDLSNRNEFFTHTSNGNFEQKLLSNQTISIAVPTMNPSIDQKIAPIVVAPHTLLTTAPK